MDKKADFKLIIGIIVVVIFGILVWSFLESKIKGTGGSVVDFMKGQIKPKSEEQKQEETRIESNLKDYALSSFEEFSSKSMECSKSSSVPSCICSTIDLTKLNDHYIKLTRTEQGQIAELLDKSYAPTGKEANLGDVYFVADLFNVGQQYVLLSKDKITYNFGDNQVEKSEEKMQWIKFIKLGKGRRMQDPQPQHIILSETSDAGACQ